MIPFLAAIAAAALVYYAAKKAECLIIGICCLLGAAKGKPEKAPAPAETELLSIKCTIK